MIWCRHALPNIRSHFRYSPCRKDPHFIAPGERKFDRGLERRGGMEEKARDGFRSLCASPTHFDQLAKILTGYEITGARSSGIFMGILSIAVGSLFKITAVPFRAAVERTAAYRW
ncbi:hypothetical protein V8G54_000137 (mitochondrion) [Vigna mungo]|uniref:NADH:quinone oxidoreductase/Mrp antiporter membrane subunit domain-containing protein n=1 Tax=Vigna mungo TaxID=3915 RepID=A0AAQ3SHE8_VIGMU